jgi:hypothetical protein
MEYRPFELCLLPPLLLPLLLRCSREDWFEEEEELPFAALAMFMKDDILFV